MKKLFFLAAIAFGSVLTLRAADYTLPFTLTPSAETFAECVTLDENHDATTGGYGGWSFSGNPKFAFKYTYSMDNQADDWLILPAVDFGDCRKVKVSFMIETYSDKEDFQVMLGHTPTVGGMTQTVMTQTDFSQTSFGELSAEVELPADGSNEWYLGFHVTSPRFRGWIYVNDIRIEAVQTVEITAKPLAPVIKSGSVTDLDYNAVVTMPSLDTNGSALTGTMDLRILVDGTLRQTISGCAAGADIDVALTLEAGGHTITFLAVKDGTEGEPVSATVEASARVAVPAVPEIAGVVMDFLNLSANVLMPALDTDGKEITGLMNLLCKVDGTVVKTMTGLSAGATATFNHTLTPGQHTIGFIASLSGQNGGEATTVVEAVEQTLTLPFNMAASAETFAQCKVIDANGDGSEYGSNGKWTYDSGKNDFVYTYHSSNQADDWMILPMVDFGDTRKVKVSLSVKTGDYNECFDVKLGNARTIAAMTIPVMKKENYKNAGSEYEILTATVELPAAAPSQLCLGIHAFSEADNYVIRIKDIKIEDAEIPEIIPAKPVIRESSANNLSYSATVIMPSLDTAGNELSGNMTLEVLVDGEVVDTRTDCAPGADINIDLILEAGRHVMGFRAVLGENTGAPVVERITATAIETGDLPFSFVASQETFDQCEVIDLDGSVDNGGNIQGAWSYAMSNGFKYTYNPGSDADDWLIIPLVDFGSSSKVRIAVDVKTQYDTEDFEIMLGHERTVDAMTLPVMKHTGFVSKDKWTTLSAIVDIPADAAARQNSGYYALGIHAISPANHYNIYFDNIRIESLELLSSGIDTVETDEFAEPEYYNLQGVRVDKPESGIYIMRRGNKTVKIKL